MELKNSLLYTHDASNVPTRIVDQSGTVSVSSNAYASRSFDNRDKEIPIVVPNVSMQQALAAKRKSKKIAITIFVIVCLLILVAAVLLAVYMKSDKYVLRKFNQSDLFFTVGDIAYTSTVPVPLITDVDSFETAVAKHSSLADFDSASIHFKAKPSLIGYDVAIEDESIVKIIGGKIYGIKKGSTTVSFYGQDGTFLSDRAVIVE